MKTFPARHSLIFSLLILVTLFCLTFLSRAILPSAIVGSVSGLSPGALSQPSGLGGAFKSLKTADNLFWVLSILLAAALLSWLRWWREAGFRRSRRRNWYLLIPPLALCTLALSGGIQSPSAGLLVTQLIVMLLATFGEEIIFRGVLWKALIPTGPIRAMFATSLLSGALQLGRVLSDGPWPEAVYVTLLAFCGGFTWAALRFRTRSIWPAFIVHTTLVFTTSLALLGPGAYPIFLIAITLGSLIYGLFLLRNRSVRADGG